MHGGYVHPKSLPVVSPSEEWEKSILHIFDKGTATEVSNLYSTNICLGYSSHRDHLKSYVEAGQNLNKFLKHRKGNIFRTSDVSRYL